MAEIKLMVEGGKATAGPPLGPSLAPLGVNIGQIVAQINEKTKSYAGMKVPVIVEVDKQKNFNITIGSPPTSALILKEAKAQKGGANQKTDNVGNLTIEQVKKIARMKAEAIGSTTIKSMAREVIGTCNSMSITIEGKKAKEIQKEIQEGKWDKVLEN